MSSFVDLVTDPIVNVRLMLSETLSKLFQKYEKLEEIENLYTDDFILQRTKSLQSNSSDPPQLN